VIRTDGMSVLPGLWDMHVHTMLAGHADYAHWDETYAAQFETIIMPAAARQLLLAGVTSARDLGAPLEASLSVRDAIRDGRIPGPTLYVSGPFLQHAPYPGEEAYRWGIKGVADARAKVRQLAAAGVDTIKLIDQDRMDFPEVEAVVDEAHRHGLPVVAHAHRPEEIRRGLKAGVDCFEHTGLATAPEYPPDVIAMLRERTADSSAGPLFWTPTLQGMFNYARKRDTGDWLDDTSWHLGLPAAVVEDIRSSLRHRSRLSYSAMVPYRQPTIPRKFAQLRESGVMLLVGTDSGIPMTFHSQSTWRELQAWVDVLGVDPMEAIRAATFWPAVLMKVSKDVGTVAEGKYADIIAVRGDVLVDISLLEQPALVIKHGTRYR
jgi:imidazolonepropionase-like amidohydrolase